MFTSGDLAKVISECLAVPRATVDLRVKQLRTAGRLSKKGRGPRSAAAMTETDVVNVLLATCLTHGYGSDVVANVDHARSHRGHIITVPKAFLVTATFTKATSAGEALDCLFADLRAGRINRDMRMDVSLEAFGAWVGLGVSIPGDDQLRGAAAGTFRTTEQHAPVDRQTNIHSNALIRLADALGPPPS